jgi:hypothetical protein
VSGAAQWELLHDQVRQLFLRFLLISTQLPPVQHGSTRLLYQQLTAKTSIFCNKLIKFANLADKQAALQNIFFLAIIK